MAAEKDPADTPNDLTPSSANSGGDGLLGLSDAQRAQLAHAGIAGLCVLAVFQSGGLLLPAVWPQIAAMARVSLAAGHNQEVMERLAALEEEVGHNADSSAEIRELLDQLLASANAERSSELPKRPAFEQGLGLVASAVASHSEELAKVRLRAALRAMCHRESDQVTHAALRVIRHDLTLDGLSVLRSKWGHLNKRTWPGMKSDGRNIEIGMLSALTSLGLVNHNVNANARAPSGGMRVTLTPVGAAVLNLTDEVGNP